MSRLRLLAATAVAALSIAAAKPVAAQSATINVSANVQTPLTLTTIRPLDFTTVFPGLPKTVTAAGGANGATSGLVQVAGQSAAQVNVSFTLPTNLQNGTNLLPIGFGATAGCVNVANSATGCTTFNPTTALQQNLSGTGGLFVFLGGTVSPTATQAAGTYTGTVTMNVAYTGN